MDCSVTKSEMLNEMPNKDCICELAELLKTLGHSSRLMIVEALGKKSYCVCDLTAMIGADTSTVSKHLSLLKAAGIVRREKQGTHVYYSLTCPCVIDAVAQLKPLIKEKLQHYSHMIEVSNP